MRRRPIPHPQESLDNLREAGSTDAPTEGPEAHLTGLLDLAAYVAEHKKAVSFPDFSWQTPHFHVDDDKAHVRIDYAPLDSLPDLEATLQHANDLPAGQAPGDQARYHLLALDLHTSPHITEFQLTHHLYGEITLYHYPHRPPHPADPRIDEAREMGWAKTLKDHNLLPGRGIVVHDEHHGLFLTQPRLTARLQGVLALFADGHTGLYWNPFSDAPNEAEMQYWLAWGMGAPASEWKQVDAYAGDAAIEGADDVPR